MLPSFPALRRKNLETIYGNSYSDRSPKGSVDTHIQNFVDCINQHPRYVTLSSCSGRISLFDPSKHAESADDNDDTTTRLDDIHDDDIRYSATTKPPPETHGKGGSGGWLFVSHDLITPSDIEPYISSNNNSNTSTASSCLLLFQFEAFLLHVAAASLADGQQLLQTALASGLRESGLIVTERRVTVALRTTRFRLAVPLGVVNRTHHSLVAHANACLKENWALLQRAHGAVEQLLFPQPRVRVVVARKEEEQCLLYGHTAAVQPQNGTITVLGGYGPGVSDRASRRGRSDAVYCRTPCATAWRQLHHHDQPPQPETVATMHGPLRVQPLATWSGRQGAAAAPLGGLLDDDGGDPVAAVLVFGGRYGPSQPLGDLVIVLLGEDQSSFVSITSVRGPIPSPRWGHTLTATDQSATSWVLVGGRNAKCAVDDVVYRGSLLPMTSSGEADFVWERVDTLQKIPPVFHHAAVDVRDGRSVFIFGGLASVRHCSTPLQLAAIITPDGVQRLNDTMFALPYQFGHQMNVIPYQMSAMTWILVSGGVTNNKQQQQSIVTCLQLAPSSKPNKPPTLHVVPMESQVEDVGVLVHHSAIEVAPGTLLLLGGGVPGFAFGDAWAPSMTVTAKVQWQDDCCDAPGTGAAGKQGSAVLMTPTAPSPSKVPVLYAHKIDAKAVKDALQKASFLDKNHRITSVDPQGVEELRVEESSASEPLDWMNHVAIPVVALDKSLRDWPATAGSGHQECPLSTRKFASRKK